MAQVYDTAEELAAMPRLTVKTDPRETTCPTCGEPWHEARRNSIELTAAERRDPAFREFRPSHCQVWICRGGHMFRWIDVICPSSFSLHPS